jgi:hypothetical protein
MSYRGGRDVAVLREVRVSFTASSVDRLGVSAGVTGVRVAAIARSSSRPAAMAKAPRRVFLPI